MVCWIYNKGGIPIDVGDITWFCPEAFGVSSFFKRLASIVKKKEKVFDPLGTSLKGEQDHEISSSMKLLS